MNNISQGLMDAGHKVRILTIYTHKHDFMPEIMSEEYLNATNIEGVYVDTKLNVVDAYSSILTSDSYNVSRFFSTDFDIKLTRILKNETFDVIHLESLFMTPYIGTIRRFTNASIVLRAHNLEFVIWEKIAKGSGNILKKLYLTYLSKKLKKYELKIMNEVAGVASISDEDKKRFQSLGVHTPIINIPFGIDYHNYQIQETGEPELALFHLGSMDWSPNQEGIAWFLNEIWPKVHANKPSLKLYLAGRNMPEYFTRGNWPNVYVIGEVEDAKAFMQSKSIMIVPLLSAGGVRVKIIEGLALGKAIISTSIGAEGIDCNHDEQMLIADSVGEWVKGINRLLEEPGLLKKLGEAGKNHTKKFDNSAIITDLVDFYKSLKKK
ncbi:MAG: glycosyltransferase family 4 protein [Flavobacteriales bacterium]